MIKIFNINICNVTYQCLKVAIFLMTNNKLLYALYKLMINFVYCSS
jgi:hypothetical protein